MAAGYLTSLHSLPSCRFLPTDETCPLPTRGHKRCSIKCRCPKSVYRCLQTICFLRPSLSPVALSPHGKPVRRNGLKHVKCLDILCKSGMSWDLKCASVQSTLLSWGLSHVHIRTCTFWRWLSNTIQLPLPEEATQKVVRASRWPTANLINIH